MNDLEGISVEGRCGIPRCQLLPLDRVHQVEPLVYLQSDLEGKVQQRKGLSPSRRIIAILFRRLHFAFRMIIMHDLVKLHSVELCQIPPVEIPRPVYSSMERNMGIGDFFLIPWCYIPTGELILTEPTSHLRGVARPLLCTSPAESLKVSVCSI